MLSDQALRGLSYGMEEVNCSRGQILYRQDEDPADKVYLVKRGEFQCFKMLVQDADRKGELMKNVLKNASNDKSNNGQKEN